jgi:hypothetical protein
MPVLIQRVGDWFREFTRKAVGPSDEWRLLLAKYTGWMLVFHIVFASIYFLPLLIRLLIFSDALPLATEAELESLRSVLEDDVSTWDLLLFGFLGTKSVAGWIAVSLSVAFLTYNCLRLLLTFRVAWLKRGGKIPAPGAYHWMYRVHMPWMYLLFALSVTFAALRIYDALHLRAILTSL